MYGCNFSSAFFSLSFWKIASFSTIRAKSAGDSNFTARWMSLGIATPKIKSFSVTHAKKNAQKTNFAWNLLVFGEHNDQVSGHDSLRSRENSVLPGSSVEDVADADDSVVQMRLIVEQELVIQLSFRRWRAGDQERVRFAQQADHQGQFVQTIFAAHLDLS